MNTKEYWENIFQTKTEDQMSWFQPYPKTSVEFLNLFNLPLSANIIDVGAGESHLVDVLLERGYKNIWVLDISTEAIEQTKRRLGQKSKKIHWINADVTEFDFNRLQFDFWHDRAAFHFLTDEEKICKYVSVAEHAISEGGYLILGTFSEQGPKQCSGLEITQYSERSMSARFEVGFERIKCIHEDHITPFNTVQNFLFCSFKRKPYATHQGS
ncbi:MAG TPA: class I SAM-dependent methyltransferase [Chitinophagaceae bacterium]|nr:class I SAM-dependent methyltransferase [Chitinophagaceae bacterium]